MFCSPAQSCGGRVSSSSLVHVDLVDAFSASPARTRPGLTESDRRHWRQNSEGFSDTTRREAAASEKATKPCVAEACGENQGQNNLRPATAELAEVGPVHRNILGNK